MRHFATERISLAVQAYATAQRCLDLTLAWCRDRETFGRPLASRQVVRHRLAEMATRIDAARTYVRRTAMRVASGEPLVTEVAMAKNIAVAACDSSSTRPCSCTAASVTCATPRSNGTTGTPGSSGIGGGTTEIMNEIIAKRLGV